MEISRGVELVVQGFLDYGMPFGFGIGKPLMNGSFVYDVS